jgi:hypothetical protein
MTSKNGTIRDPHVASKNAPVEHLVPETLDADVCDQLIAQFRARLDALQQEATAVREEFDRLHQRWIAHLESRNGT